MIFSGSVSSGDFSEHSESGSEEWNQDAGAAEDNDFWDYPFPEMGGEQGQDQAGSNGELLRPPNHEQDEHQEEDPVRLVISDGLLQVVYGVCICFSASTTADVMAGSISMSVRMKKKKRKHWTIRRIVGMMAW